MSNIGLVGFKCPSFLNRCFRKVSTVKFPSPIMEVLETCPDVVNGIVRQSSKVSHFNLAERSAGLHFRDLSILNLQMIGVDPTTAKPLRFGLDPLTATEQMIRDIQQMRVADFFVPRTSPAVDPAPAVSNPSNPE